jgi:hypothetical protein
MFLGDMAIRPANRICHITGFQDLKRLRMANVTTAQVDVGGGRGSLLWSYQPPPARLRFSLDPLMSLS